MNKIREYRTSILDTLDEYELEQRIIIRELKNEFTEEFIDEIEVDDFLESLKEPIKEKNKFKIKKLFSEYIHKLNKKLN